MKQRNPLYSDSSTAPLGEPHHQPQAHINTLPSGKITNGSMNHPSVRLSNG